ncbi:pyruvate kinase [Mycobacterium antarcticum]|uniref:pyruvate kinase n=1 Tax=Mycolicibacterium sp. TUM20983 TaxID=3023369 RepID=UPI0023A472BA|nr:pyruvate kinase [Mycolicibacterium sp. TUM20983]GLP74800.1 pyruvate kinase [Mycolicibacterium sp. TUM20983]
MSLAPDRVRTTEAVALTGGDNAARDRLARLLGEVDALLVDLSDAESAWSHSFTAVTPEHQVGARNMVHYWALRQTDLRKVQTRLAQFGLSSLGRSEPHVETTLHLVRSALVAMSGGPWAPPEPIPGAADGPALLRRHTVDLLGLTPPDRRTRIMVTLPSSAATDPDAVRRLLERGMNIARINCAHDDAAAWRAMARNVRDGCAATGRSCLIAVDLAGPKLRTGPLQPGPRVIKLRPSRNVLGQVIAPAQAWLAASDGALDAPDAGLPTLPVPADWLSRRRDGDVIHLHDTRGAKRRLVIKRFAAEAAHHSGRFIATCEKSTYLATGTLLSVGHTDDPTEVGVLPATEQSLRLHRGDTLVLTRDCTPTALVTAGTQSIGCTLPEVFDDARVGHEIHFDDGRISGEIVAVGHDELEVRIEHAAPAGSKLLAAKGINVPDTQLSVAALTAKDLLDLSAVAEIADMVEMSFVRAPSDVEALLDAVGRLGRDDLGIVLKIETRQAFEQLPQLLLAAMRWPRVGVMIARGDLAVECGAERMAELQEEILWLCEAAHLPVIWATQVLEQLAKNGLPSRAEISDAAMGERAECVMLNKGPYIDDAVVALDDILRRMTELHDKKNALLGPLHSWHPDPALDDAPSIG